MNGLSDGHTRCRVDVMIFRYVNVGCDRCGAPASEPCRDTKEARRMVPRNWERAILTATGKRIDICPDCLKPRAAKP